MDANCGVTFVAGLGSEPMNGLVNSADCWFVMSIYSLPTAPSSISPASGSQQKTGIADDLAASEIGDDGLMTTDGLVTVESSVFHVALRATRTLRRPRPIRRESKPAPSALFQSLVASRFPGIAGHSDSGLLLVRELGGIAEGCGSSEIDREPKGGPGDV